MVFTEPGDARWIAYRETQHEGEPFHFCSSHCQEIFEHEPAKYAQSWLPVHQIYQGNCYPDDINPASPGDSPVREVLRYYEPSDQGLERSIAERLARLREGSGE